MALHNGVVLWVSSNPEVVGPRQPCAQLFSLLLLVQVESYVLPYSLGAGTVRFQLQRPFDVKARRQPKFYQHCISAVLLPENSLQTRRDLEGSVLSKVSIEVFGLKEVN